MRILRVHTDDQAPQGNPLESMFPKSTVEQAHVSHLTPVAPLPSRLQGEIFDIIYCAFALQTVEPALVPKTVETMTQLLADRGELWLVTPSLEWCAYQIQAEEPSPAVHTVLYGEPGRPHRCGFTLAWLRALVEGAGLTPRRCYQGRYHVRMGEQVVEIPSNIVIGWKVLQ